MIFKISVPDMHCENCAKRIENSLAETDINFSVNLEDKIVTVDGCEHCLSTALNELEDLGFTPKKL